jgi:hypothetical protein
MVSGCGSSGGTGWCQMLARQKRRQLRSGVDAEELEKVVLGGRSRVVSVMRVRCAKGSDGLWTPSERH